MQERIWPSFGEQPWDIRIFVADEAQINAFAIPGGIIVFHSGLIFAAETPEEVAAVLAHEIAHVTHRHSVTHCRQRWHCRRGAAYTRRCLLSRYRRRADHHGRPQRS